MTASTIVLGRPGGHASTLVRNARMAMVKWSAAVAVATLGSVAAFVWVHPVAALGLGSVAVWAGTHISEHHVRSMRAAVGANAEKRVAAALNRTGAEIVAHGMKLTKNGDADHIVLGPQCVAVETKYGRGEVRVTNGILYAGNRPLGPLEKTERQVTIQARKVRELTGAFCSTVICVSEMRNRPFRYKNSVICSARDLPGVIANLPKPFKTKKILDVAAVTAELNRSIEP